MQKAFRYYDETYNRFYYQRLYNNKLGDTFPLNEPIGRLIGPMQDTGLKDKNGKKIFEGDIVNRYRVDLIGTKEDRLKAGKQIIKTSKVEWCDEEGCYIIEGDTNIYVYKNYNNLEVIGNIHENPELIK